MEKISKEKFEEIKELAMLVGVSINDIAIITDIDPELFKQELRDKKSEIYEAFMSGKLQLKVDFSVKLKKLALQGSAPAQALLLKIQKEAEYKKLNDYYGE